MLQIWRHIDGVRSVEEIAHADAADVDVELVCTCVRHLAYANSRTSQRWLLLPCDAARAGSSHGFVRLIDIFQVRMCVRSTPGVILTVRLLVLPVLELLPDNTSHSGVCSGRSNAACLRLLLECHARFGQSIIRLQLA